MFLVLAWTLVATLMVWIGVMYLAQPTIYNFIGIRK